MVVRRSDGRRRRIKSSINSPETGKALDICQGAVQELCTGNPVLDSIRLKTTRAFLDGQISWTNQRHLDLLHREKLGGDEKIQGDGRRYRGTAIQPIGPVGHPTERHLTVTGHGVGYTKYPNAREKALHPLHARKGAVSANGRRPSIG
jgi:multiple sugar transport system substrate-binding protein